jgi:hypothetical protein
LSLPLYLIENLIFFVKDFTINIDYSLFFLKNTLTFNFSTLFLGQSTGFVENFLTSIYIKTFTNTNLEDNVKSQPHVTSKKIDGSSNLFQNLLNVSTDLSDNTRILKASNPVFKYDYRSGNYLPDRVQDIFTSLFKSFSEISAGMQLPS